MPADEPVALLEPLHRELLRAGVNVSRDGLSLRPLPGNSQRIDHQQRRHYWVADGDPIVAFLTVGSLLRPLWEKARRFAEVCPGIACRPLAWISCEAQEAILYEYFPGKDLETLVAERLLSTTDAKAAARKVWEALEKTRSESSLPAATEELDQLFQSLLAGEYFSDIDRKFLTEYVFPLVRGAVLQPPFYRRWTNGDFVPRNILRDEQGALRLIDCEFASQTHFASDDAWRWKTFSTLPADGRELNVPQEEQWQHPGYEALCILRHLVLAYEVNGVDAAKQDVLPSLERLSLLATENRADVRSSAFLSLLPEAHRLKQSLVEKENLLVRQNRTMESLKTKLAEQERQLQHAHSRINFYRQSFWSKASIYIRMLQGKAGLQKKQKFQLHIDSPKLWVAADHKIEARGWCFSAAGLDLGDIRIEVDDRSYPGTYGLSRPDVFLAFGQEPRALHCGFIIPCEILAGDRELRIMVCDPRDQWHVAYRYNLRRPPETIRGTYAHWIKEYDTLTAERLEKIKASVLSLAFQPKVSIVLPTYNTPENLLRRAIDSVRSQVYPHWELCIADDASSAPHVGPLLQEYQKADPRIRVTFRSENGHIAAASNTALHMATGEYVAMLDHDDEIRPHALAAVVEALNQHRDAELLYSDEDKIDEFGNRSDPYFKPDWMPDLHLGHNYLCHFSVCRTSLLRHIGGWRSSFDGAQDWDLELRLIEAIRSTQIVHIPSILYHWRAVAGSTALATSEKDYVVEAARRAIAEHLQRTGCEASLVHLPGNHWRVRYAVPAPAPLVSLLIPTRNGLNFLQQCIESIVTKTTYPNYEIIVVDNASDDDATLQYLEQLSKRRTGAHAIRVLRYSQPFNYSAINNFAAQAARGEYLGLLNNDLEVITPDWLEEMVGHAARPGIGCVGPMLYYPNNTLQHAGVVLGIAGHAGHAFKGFRRGTGGYMNHAHLVKNYSAVTGACLLIRKSLFDQVGGLDEKDLAIALSDVDLCLKVLAVGCRNVWTPFAELYHHESVSRGYEDTPEKQARFARERGVLRQRWLALIEHDPAYNPNLTVEAEDFSLAYPPRAL